MKVVFIATECENYATMLFSSLLKQRGHRVYLIFDPRLFGNDEINQPFLSKMFDIRKHNIRKLKEIKPDLIGFSTYTQDYQWNLSFARMIKKEMDTPIIFGGVHCVLCHREVIKEDCVDMVCSSGGERAILRVVEKGIKKGQICCKEIENLDTLPLPDRDLFYEQKPIFKKDYTIATSRGCPYSCSFCASATLREILKVPVRQRSVHNVIAELEWAKECYDFRSVYFTDDVFTLNTAWLREFAEHYSFEVGVPFYCTANPGTITEEQLRLLEKAGCQMIGFGLQSACERTRIEILNRKGTNEQIQRVANVCRGFNLSFSFDHIFSIPNDNGYNQVKAINFYNETRPDLINTFTMTYLPRITLNEVLSEEERDRVNSGQVRTSMLQRGDDCFASMFAILPLLPRRVISWLVGSGLYRYVRLPHWLRLVFKDIKRLIIGRSSDVWFPIKLLLVNIKDNIKVKIGGWNG